MRDAGALQPGRLASRSRRRRRALLRPDRRRIDGRHHQPGSGRYPAARRSRLQGTGPCRPLHLGPDAERCVIARSTHPIGSRPSPAGARLDPSLEPRRSAVLISGLATGPPAGVGGGLGPFLAVGTPRFSTFLNILRLICSVHGYPARRAGSTADSDDSTRWRATNTLCR